MSTQRVIIDLMARLLFVISVVGIAVITVGVTIVSAVVTTLFAILLLLLPFSLFKLHIAALTALRFLANSSLEEIFLGGNRKDKLLIAVNANQDFIFKTLLLHTSPPLWDTELTSVI